MKKNRRFYFVKAILIATLCISSVMMVEASSNALQNNRIEQVLNFWFDYANHSEPLYSRAEWWQKEARFDNAIREQFAQLRQDAIDGKLNHWLDTPKGMLAYIILIDQFSRNLYRDSKEMYQYDDLALKATLKGLYQGFDQTLSLTESVFFYMPLEHSENIEYQLLSVEKFTQLLEKTPEICKPIAENYLKFAKEHYQIIEKFHRFPHRNKILERASTPEEIEALKSHTGW